MHNFKVIEVISTDIGNNRIDEEEATSTENETRRNPRSATPATPGDPTTPAIPWHRRNQTEINRTGLSPETLICDLPFGTDYKRDEEILVVCYDKFSNLKGYKTRIEFQLSFTTGGQFLSHKNIWHCGGAS